MLVATGGGVLVATGGGVLVATGGGVLVGAGGGRVLVGSAKSPLHDRWSDLMMVYYPSRRHFLRMLSGSPVRGIQHRDAGLARAVLMPCSHRAS